MVSGLGGDEGQCNVVGGLHPPDVADDKFLRTADHKAATGVLVGGGEGFLDVLDGEIEQAELVGIDLHSELLEIATHRSHLGDAGNGQNRWPQRELRDGADIHRRECFAGNTDQGDLAHDAGRGRHDRHDAGGQLLCDGAHPLGDDLAVVFEIRAPLELDEDDREPK